jgi:glutaconyl-CoA/methylmalonyl-CoA decarboxylase subunit gamma
MKKYEFKINGNDYSVRVKSLDGSKATVEVNGSVYEVELKQEVKTTKTPILVRSAPVATPPKSMAPAAGLKKVVAPLPGIIHKMKVKEGDVVKPGDILFILEAMKMENNILAEKDGTVKNLKVKEGDAVLQGDVILEIE